jgi:hypothetical protein
VHGIDVPSADLVVRDGGGAGGGRHGIRPLNLILYSTIVELSIG